jgi:hypothetical protein
MSDKAAMFYIDSPEQKEKYRRVSEAVVDLLKKEFASPVEAYGLLRFVQLGFEDTYGIKGTLLVNDKDVAHA